MGYEGGGWVSKTMMNKKLHKDCVNRVSRMLNTSIPLTLRDVPIPSPFRRWP